MHLPVSAEVMAAALYAEKSCLRRADLAADEDVWGQVALAVVQDGLIALGVLAYELRSREKRGTVREPGWLAFCRQRVSDVLGGAA
jgi:hypothetical protein